PFADLDLTDTTEPSPPRFAPLVDTLSAALDPWFAVLETAYAVLFAEIAFGLLDDLEGSIGEFEAARPTTTTAADISDLTAAENVYRSLPGDVATLHALLPETAFQSYLTRVILKPPQPGKRHFEGGTTTP